MKRKLTRFCEWCKKPILKRGKRFCSETCFVKSRIDFGWFQSKEYIKSLNTMSPSRNKLKYRVMKHTEGE